jgi:hypothetical protein
MALAMGLQAAEPRPGDIQLSDGTSWIGAIALIPGGSLQVHDGSNVKTIDVVRIRSLRMRATKEHLERNFRMPEAGKAFREEVGEPYPVREFTTDIELVDGTAISGHLTTTAMTIDVTAPDAKADDPPTRHKVILPAKLQGKPGEGFATLVFPAVIRFNDQPAVGPAAAATRLEIAGAETLDLSVLTRDGLAVLSCERSALGAFAIEPALGAGMFLAVRGPSGIVVGWPGSGDAALKARLVEALKDANDFFDERIVIGVWRPDGSNDAFSLLRLARRGVVVDSPEKPWGVEIWRWHLEGDGGRVMLAGRGKLFRGMAATPTEVPPVTLSTSLWNPEEKGGVLRVGGIGK